MGAPATATRFEATESSHRHDGAPKEGRPYNMARTVDPKRAQFDNQEQMPKKPKLSKSMTEEQFNNGYWYAVEIKAFADEIGIPFASKLRKDELEKLIHHFLRTGEVKSPTRKNLSKSDVRDIEKGLSLKLPVVSYTSNKQTKDFIVKEALKIAPDLKRKSGARYRLNRWREEKRDKGIKITLTRLLDESDIFVIYYLCPVSFKRHRY